MLPLLKLNIPLFEMLASKSFMLLLLILFNMDREFVYNWECPKCEEVNHAFVEDSDLEPLAKQIEEHMKEAHGMSEKEVHKDNGMFDEVWCHHCSSVQLSGKPDELMIQ